MAMVIDLMCRTCGNPLTLDCGDFFPENKLDLTLTCDNECGAPVLNAFVAFDDFQAIEEEG